MGKTVTIHGNEWLWEDVQDKVQWAQSANWELKVWKVRPALVDPRGTVTLFVGQKYPPDKLELVADAWNHDHCEICYWTMNESDNPDVGTGYTVSGEEWICCECFEQFVSKEAK